MSSTKAKDSNGAATSVARHKSAAKVRPAPGGSDARRRAAAILEVLAGVRTPTDAAAALSISLPRYYLLEQQALAGLVKACEPRSKGRVQTVQSRVSALEKEVARLERECGRQQSLARAAQRAIGLPAAAVVPRTSAPKAGTPRKGQKARRRRPTVRALRAAAALAEAAVSPAVEGVQTRVQDQDRPPDDGSSGAVADPPR